MNNSLYLTTNKFIELFNREDLTEEEFKEKGEQLGLTLQNKAGDIVKLNFILESNKSACKQEMDRLKDIYKSFEKKQESLYKDVKENMERLNIDKIPTEVGNIVIKKNPASVKITDETLISPEYIKEKIEKSIDKTQIGKDLKAGMTVLGAELSNSNTRLEIK